MRPDCSSPDCSNGEPPIGALLARASHLLSAAVAERLASEGLSLRGFVVLHAASTAAQPQQALAVSVGVDKTTMVAAVDDLAALGLVERRPDPQDRRVRLVALTAEGARVLRRAQGAVAATEEELLGELGHEGRAALRDLLVRLVQGKLGARAVGGSCV